MQSEMTETLHVLDETIEYDVTRSDDATRPRIDVDIRGVRVVLPTDSDLDPHELVEDNTQWVLDSWREYQDYREQAPSRSFTPGEHFPFRGGTRRLAVRDVERSHVTSDEVILATDAVERRGIQDELEALYRSEARDVFGSRIDHYADEMDVEPGQLELRNQRTRWASCSRKRTLSFNWRLVMAPDDVIDYVVIHELTHLLESNHTRRFWSIVSKYDPEYKSHAEWLDENSVQLIFTADDL